MKMQKNHKLREAIFMDSGDDPRSYDDIYGEDEAVESLGPAEIQHLRDLAHQILAIIGEGTSADIGENSLKESKSKKLKESSCVTVKDVVDAAKYMLDNGDYSSILYEDEDYSIIAARSLLKDIVSGKDLGYIQELIDDWEQDGDSYDADTIVLNYLGLGNFPD